MKDKLIIYIGTVIFALLFTIPLWMNLFGGTKAEQPELVYPKDEKQCIQTKEYMRAFHMDLLNQWRDSVVRLDARYFNFKGKQTEMSLSKTCMGCHTSKADFCDRCHNYLGVKPYCWDCHVTPEEVKP